MDQSGPTAVRFGRTDYINTRPVLYGFDRKIVRETFVATHGEPSMLNRLLAEGRLDISLISSAAYAANSKKYLILPNLSISSFGPVKSVLLLSSVPFEKLDGAPVMLTESSGTSIHLIRLLLKELYAAVPLGKPGKVGPYVEPGGDCCAMLVIGDDALIMRRLPGFPYVLDLGEAWRRLTGLPFVFALWAVRREFFSARPEACRKIHRAIVSSKEYGLTHLDEISNEVHTSANLTTAECAEYLDLLRYDLNGPYLKGLESFFNYLYKMKVVPDPVDIRFAE